MSTIALFASTFGVVFFLGFQSLAVNSGNYWLAGINSLIIGAFNLMLYKTAPHVHGWQEIGAYVTGGPLGILSAMWVHRNVVTYWRELKSADSFWQELDKIYRDAKAGK